MRKSLYMLIAFSAALALRLYPAFLSGLPFSTDAWSPIRNAELLLEYTPIRLDSDVMDGYNCYWPANSLFGAVLSQIFGFKPIKAMAFGVPLAAALAVPIFYALTCWVGGSRRLAFSSSILLAAAYYPYALFTSGVTKETYANPLYMLSILIFLTRREFRGMLLFTVASLALVMAHHLTTLVAIFILASITLAFLIIGILEGGSLDRFSLLFTLILTVEAALYFGFYAYRGFKVSFTLSNLLSAFSYQTLFFALMLHLAFKPRKAFNRGMICIASAAAVSLMVFICMKKPIMPDAPTLPSRYMLYAAPFILTSPLMAVGVEEVRGMRGERSRALLFWLSTLIGFEAYSVFGDSPLGLTLAYRVINFLCVPLIIFSAFGFQGLYEACSRLLRAAAVAALMAAVALNVYSVYASISLQERYLGYFWLYRQPEYYAAAWIKDSDGSLTVAGDVKALYLLKCYFNLSVDVFQGLKYLAGNGRKPQILFTYSQMLRNGYVMYGGCSVDLPENWINKASSLNQVYSNSLVNVYVG
jgi:predicted anti-sigma-YlaC factor YlaD